MYNQSQLRKFSARTRILSAVAILLIVSLCSGCQQDHAASIPAASDEPPPTPPAGSSPPLTEQPTVYVPQGEPPIIDGTMSPGEWDSAAVETLSDGSELFLIYREGYLYLGIRANTPGMIVGNVFFDRGDEIAILHASAALGTALYRKGVDDSWQQTQDFTWRCRETGDSESAQAARGAFLREERWVASNSRMGTPNELEYQIEVREEILRLAVNYIRASNPDVKIPWPNGLDDDCIKPTQGGVPAQLYFSPDRWAIIRLSLSQEE